MLHVFNKTLKKNTISLKNEKFGDVPRQDQEDI